MKFTGWTYIEKSLPWTKCFEIDIKSNDGFSGIPFEILETRLIECDLNGYVEDAFDLYYGYEIDCLFDVLFRSFAIDIKRQYVYRKNVRFQNTLVRCANYLDLENGQTEKALMFKTEKCAQCIVIDDTYIYFSCTSEDFWKDCIDNEFNGINLGGAIVKIGAYPTIDNYLKDIL